MKPPRPLPLDLLAEARRVIASGDRELALQLLLKIGSGGERTASELPEATAEALVATARRQRDDNDRSVLQAHRDGSIARDDIVSMIRGAPLAPDDLAVIRAALDERQARDLLARQGAAAQVVQIARETAAAELVGREGPALAVKLGRGYLEIKYIPRGKTGRVSGPYLYQRWSEGRVRRSRYLGKPAT
jgi:hypothetical protein